MAEFTDMDRCLMNAPKAFGAFYRYVQLLDTDGIDVTPFFLMKTFHNFLSKIGFKDFLTITMEDFTSNKMKWSIKNYTNIIASDTDINKVIYIGLEVLEIKIEKETLTKIKL